MLDLLKKNLKYLRISKGMKQKQMLSEIGFKPSRWNSYEHAGVEPRYLDLIKIADYFNASIDQLLRVDIEKQTENGKLKKPYEANKENSDAAQEPCIFCEYKDEIIKAKNGEIGALKSALTHAEERLKR